jgi:predicted lipoprotein with Yx(FWY)xxD motif
MPYLFVLAAAALQVPAVPPEVQIIAQGGRLVLRSNPADMPLYTFDKDRPGRSRCVDRCAAAWPPLKAPAGAKPTGGWSIVMRADGTGQWALDGRPVYTFARDREGTPSGDGMGGGAWRLLPTYPAR